MRAALLGLARGASVSKTLGSRGCAAVQPNLVVGDYTPKPCALASLGLVLAVCAFSSAPAETASQRETQAQILQDGNWPELTRRAQEFVKAAGQARLS